MLRWSAGRRARRAAPDAIHVIGVPMTRAGTRAARRAHVPLIVDRGADTAAVPRTRFGVRRERRLLQGASAIVTGSESDAQKLRDRQGQRVNPLVCRNIPEPLRVSPTPAKLRRRLRLPSGGLVLMSGDELLRSKRPWGWRKRWPSRRTFIWWYWVPIAGSQRKRSPWRLSGSAVEGASISSGRFHRGASGHTPRSRRCSVLCV